MLPLFSLIARAYKCLMLVSYSKCHSGRKKTFKCDIKEEDLCMHVKATNYIILWFMSYLAIHISIAITRFCWRSSTLSFIVGKIYESSQTMKTNFKNIAYFSNAHFYWFYEVVGQPGLLWYRILLQSIVTITFFTVRPSALSTRCHFGVRKQIKTWSGCDLSQFCLGQKIQQLF